MRSERGSITLFVLVAMIFFLAIAMGAYVSASNKLQGQNGDVEQIKTGYEQDLTKTGLASLYDKLVVSNGKTVTELTADTATIKMKVGDYVDYTAGTWAETKATPTAQGEFGGYTSGNTKETNVQGAYSSSRPTYSGWRIWSIDGNIVTLITAGCPEKYYHEFGSSADSETILTSTRNWNLDYVNTRKHGLSARALTKADVDTWYKTNIDSSITNTRNVQWPTLNEENKKIVLLDNNNYYYLASAFNSNAMWCATSSGRTIMSTDGRISFGVRVLVTLNSDVLFYETPTSITEEGCAFNSWSIAN